MGMKQVTLDEYLMIEQIKEVPTGEEIELDFFNVKSFQKELIKSCQGDLFVICNVLCQQPHA